MKFISAGEFKARCLRVMDEVQATSESVVVTKNGKPVVKLIPAVAQARDVFGCLAGVVEIVGDIEAPVADPKEWNALR
jgi:prevent-host-death family protein